MGGIDHSKLLGEKGRLLIARERELYALRQVFSRQKTWLQVAQRMSALLQNDPDDGLANLAEELVQTLGFHRVSFYRVNAGAELTLLCSSPPLGPSSARQLPEFVSAQPSGIFESPEGSATAEAGSLFSMERFLWHRAQTTELDILAIAGFDKQRSQFHSGFGESDLKHFASTTIAIALLLSNTALLRQVSEDRARLQRFSEELESRVESRTAQLEMLNLELESTLGALRRRNAHIEDDLQRSKKFQQQLLSELPECDRLEFAVRFRPLHGAGGDIYDVFELSPGRYRMFLADAPGHGTQAAMRTIILKLEYDRFKATADSPEQVLSALNTRLLELFEDAELMCTACCVDLIEQEDGVAIVYSNAAHCPLLVFGGAAPQEIYQPSSLLGVGPTEWGPPKQFVLSKGESLLLCTDGLTEQVGPRGERFDSVLLERGTLPGSRLSEALDGLMSRFDTFRGKVAIIDDVSVVAVQVVN